MKNHYSFHWASFLTLCLTLAANISTQALTIQGRVTNADSKFIYLKSSWQRKDSCAFDENGNFKFSLNNSPYEKVFYLTWKPINNQGGFITMILEPKDIVEVYCDFNEEKINFIKGDVARKAYLELLLKKTSGANHDKYKLKTKVQIDSVNHEIFKCLNELFREDPILAIECMGFMRYTLFQDEYSWQQMPQVWKLIQAVPKEVKANSPIYQALAERIWPGKRMLELSFLDTSNEVHGTHEIKDKPILILFGASWCRPCRVNNQAYKAQFEKLEGKIELLGISIEESYQDWVEYAQRNELPWKQGFWISDESMDRNLLRELYHLNFIPLTILIDQNRKVVKFNPSIKEVSEFSGDK